MLSISGMSGGQGAYYSGLAREDYYLEGGEPPGFWLGSGAEKLGLSGRVDKAIFSSLFDGFLNGKALVQNAGKHNHRPGWDLTFSAPKSVSVLWSQATLENALEIQAAHLSAVDKAVEYLERNAIWSRRGKGGVIAENCKTVVAAFEHGTSRAQDPQLHTHALLLNLGIREDGTIGTLETKSLYQHKMTAGAIYRAELTHQLDRRLGLTFEKEQRWFEVSGVSKTLIDTFSKRRKEIEKALADKGLKGAKASEIAALNSRETKEYVSRNQLMEQWRKIGNEIGWGQRECENLFKGVSVKKECSPDLEKFAHRSIEKIMEHQSYFTEKDVMRSVAEEAQILTVGAEMVEKVVKGVIQKSAELVNLGIKNFEKILTTKENLKLEKELVHLVSKSKDQTTLGVSDSTIEKIITKKETMTEEQKSALRHATQDKGSVSVITGMAGTGKTFLLDAIRQAYQENQHKVIGAAPSGKAARGLSDGAGIESSTIAKFLMDTQSGRRRLDGNTILIVDEAGMVGTSDMKKVVEACNASKTKLILVGDEKQLQPVVAGGPFAFISKELGSSSLTEIIRQREEWQRESVKDFAFGETNRALYEYASRGLVTITEDRLDAKEQIVQAWSEKGNLNPKENIILAGTNADVTWINRKIQESRIEQGYISTHSIQVGNNSIHEGDRVIFTRNSKALGVENGTFGKVTMVNSLLGRLTVQLDGGGDRTFFTQNYDHIKLGYAITTHASQGMTTENVFILTSEQMQDRELSYVQASRSRGETRFFTTEEEAGKNLSELARAMKISHQKKLAIDADLSFEMSH